MTVDVDRPGQGFFGDLTELAGDGQEQLPVLGVGADDDIELRPGAGHDPVDRARSAAVSSACAVSSRATGTAATASRVGGTPRFSARYRPIREAVSAGTT
jgi:hypothetical protein